MIWGDVRRYTEMYRRRPTLRTHFMKAGLFISSLPGPVRVRVRVRVTVRIRARVRVRVRVSVPIGQ